MTWQGIEGHDKNVEHFQNSLSSGRLGNTFLFVGPEGIGKRTFALKLAQSLLCDNAPEPLEPCGTCPSCAQVLAATHPDLDIVSRPADKKFIPIDLLIGDKAHRMREGLCARIAMRPACGGRKIAIIDDADHLNVEGANCLLKTLEEPPAGSVLILISSSIQRQLPTIRSRAQIVRFEPLSTDVSEKLLLEKGMVEDANEAQRLARLGSGSLAKAMEWSDPSLDDFRKELYSALRQPDWPSQLLAKTVGEFVDAAGKEAPKRRARLHQVIQMTEQFFVSLARSMSGAPPRSDGSLSDEVLTDMVAQRVRLGGVTVDSAAACVERCQLAAQHVDANANQATNIDAWIDELAVLLRQPIAVGM